MNKSHFYNVFDAEVASLTVTVGKQLGKIVGFTEKIPILLKYTKTEFGYVNNIKELMPITLVICLIFYFLLLLFNIYNIKI